MSYFQLPPNPYLPTGADPAKPPSPFRPVVSASITKPPSAADITALYSHYALMQQFGLLNHHQHRPFPALPLLPSPAAPAEAPLDLRRTPPSLFASVAAAAGAKPLPSKVSCLQCFSLNNLNMVLGII